MDAHVSIRGVARSFGDVLAVDGADLEFGSGEMVALLGPSGCGKTTLLRLLAGLEVPQAGEIVVGGTVLNGRGTFVVPERRRIGMVFQDYALFPHLNVAKNVGFGLGRSSRRDGRVAEMLGLVGLSGLEQRMPHELSGGQQQRVALARALAPEPQLLLLDEPFSNLDPSIRARVRGEVVDLIRSVGITALFVTHDQDEALSLADRVAVMIRGRILQAGRPRDVYEEPSERSVAEFMGQPNFLPGVADGTAVSFEFGAFPLRRPATGDVDVLVRSEAIVRLPEGGVSATVVSVAYYGHDEVVRLLLPSGAAISARWPTGDRLLPGAAVRLGLCGTVQAFPRD